VNPTIANAAAGAGHDVSVAAGNAGAGVANAADTANGFLSPYMAAGSGAAGTLADFMKSGGDLNRSFTGADMEAYDPGYQFRMQQGRTPFRTPKLQREW
jgi:hypothetical protein